MKKKKENINIYKLQQLYFVYTDLLKKYLLRKYFGHLAK